MSLIKNISGKHERRKVIGWGFPSWTTKPLWKLCELPERAAAKQEANLEMISWVPDFLRYLCGKAVDWMEKVSEEQYRAR